MKPLALFLLVSAPFLTLQVNQNIQETFDRYDKNEDKMISYEEMVNGLGADMGIGTPNDEAIAMIDSLYSSHDENQDKHLDLKEMHKMIG